MDQADIINQPPTLKPTRRCQDKVSNIKNELFRPSNSCLTRRTVGSSASPFFFFIQNNSVTVGRDTSFPLIISLGAKRNQKISIVESSLQKDWPKRSFHLFLEVAKVVDFF